jgi:hypothetical protein
MINVNPVRDLKQFKTFAGVWIFLLEVTKVLTCRHKSNRLRFPSDRHALGDRDKSLASSTS